MASLTEWVTDKFEEPLSPLFFFLGALLLLLGVTTGLEVPVLKRLTPDVNYRWVSIVLGCVFLVLALLLAPRIDRILHWRRTLYGIEITSPAENEIRSGDITVSGKCRRIPPKHTLFLINASRDQPGFYPQVKQKIERQKNGSWRGSVFINSDTTTRHSRRRAGRFECRASLST